jgi:hypothetical protein
MKLEVHTFDPELICVLMGMGSVPEGCDLALGDDAYLTYRRMFTGRVKHFPIILHFDVELRSERGACRVVDWLFERSTGRNVEKVVVEYQDVRMDAAQMRILLRCGR